jgi:CRP-like cAMP-binding protein
MSTHLWHLKRCDLFQRLSEEELRRVESVCRARNFPRGSPIYLPAQHADAVLLLTSGRAKICNVTDDGKQAILALVEPGELFGELSVLEDSAREEYAEAMEKSTVILIPGYEIQRLMESNPSVSISITKMIGLRRRRIERRLKSLLFRSNRERLVLLLLELAEQYGRPEPGGILIGIKLSHQDLANVIGSTRETVTVTLGELQAQGHLRLGRRRIVLTDPKRLASAAGAPAPRGKIQQEKISAKCGE